MLDAAPVTVPGSPKIPAIVIVPPAFAGIPTLFDIASKLSVPATKVAPCISPKASEIEVEAEAVDSVGSPNIRDNVEAAPFTTGLPILPATVVAPGGVPSLFSMSSVLVLIVASRVAKLVLLASPKIRANVEATAFISGLPIFPATVPTAGSPRFVLIVLTKVSMSSTLTSITPRAAEIDAAPVDVVGSPKIPATVAVAALFVRSPRAPDIEVDPVNV